MWCKYHVEIFETIILKSSTHLQVLTAFNLYKNANDTLLTVN